LENIRFCNELVATPPEMPSHAFTWYPETEFCYMRSGSLFLAAKGGHNNESHNHNDIGTFILYAGSEPILLDAGVGTYTRQTFSSERYSIWSMQSDYHNLPKINGASQRQGAAYKSSGVVADPRRRTFSLDIAGAYPAEAGIRSWRRSYRLQTGGATVTDDFSLDAPAAPNELHFMCRGEADIATPGCVRITTPTGKQAELRYDASCFEPSVESIPLPDPRLSHVWGDELLRLKLRARKVQAKGSYKIAVEIAK
ncbi:MAG: heparinase II/III-family protein, partial [Alistipes sp.]|nr:heparinase II/III-family protein [Alistipes sp.]